MLPAELIAEILFFLNLNDYINFQYRSSVRLTNILLADRNESQLRLSLEYRDFLKRPLIIGKKHPVFKLSIKLPEHQQRGRGGVNWSPLLWLSIKHIELELTHNIFSDFIRGPSFRTAARSVESLKWTVSGEKDVWLARGRISFFCNLRVLHLKGHVSDIYYLLERTYRSMKMREVRIEVFGTPGDNSPTDFYDRLPELMLHLFPNATNTPITPGADSLLETLLYSEKESSHLNGRCYCTSFFPGGSLTNDFYL